MPSTCPANIRETKIGFGFKRQMAIDAANPVGDMWSLTKTNPALAENLFNTENDAEDIGKGNDWPQNLYKTSTDFRVAVEKFLTVEGLLQASAFALGSVTETPPALGASIYDIVPMRPEVDCINLPVFTYVEQIRPGPDYLLDRAAVGCVVNDFNVSFRNGPGRDNSTISMNLIGTGKTVEPSGMVLPANYPEHRLSAGGLKVTINGIEYVTSKRIESLEFGYNNNLRADSGYFPGSGEQDGFQYRGRMEFGNTRAITLTYVARLIAGSTELAQLKTLTTGVAHVECYAETIGTSTEKFGFDATWHKAVFSVVTIGDADGIVTVQVTVTPLWKDDTDGIFTLTIYSDKAEVFTQSVTAFEVAATGEGRKEKAA